MDVGIVFLSVVGIVMEELESDLMPINPTIMRVMRVLRIARGTVHLHLKYRGPPLNSTNSLRDHSNIT